MKPSPCIRFLNAPYNPAASVDAPTRVGFRWLRLGRRATEQRRST